MAYDILDIKTQRLSTLIMDFMICHGCGIVDRSMCSTEVGRPCDFCSVPSKGGRLYWSIPIHDVIDLIQESYHSVEHDSAVDNQYEHWLRKPHRLGIVIYFTTLGELLLEHFLSWYMYSIPLPEAVSRHLLTKHLHARDRCDILFPLLLGVKWKQAIAELDEDSQLAYQGTNAFFTHVSKVRNDLVHAGRHWAIAPSVPQDCMHHLWPLANLFVALHNRYVQPIYKGYDHST